MNQSSIKPISSVRPAESTALSKTPAPSQTETQLQSNAARKAKAEAEAKIQADETGILANVSIHFRVDEKTDNVTVFLVDRKTKKVLRSIPANELQKLQIADLLKLTV